MVLILHQGFCMKTSATILIFLLLLAGLPALKAQQAILSASSNATGSSGTVTFSVGQAAFNTCTGASGTLTEGVQQPYEILFMEGLGPDKGISLECLVYPNPANDFVKLKVDKYDKWDLSCQVTGLNGVLLRDMKITGTETLIPVDKLVSGTYFLIVILDDKPVQTYKIIKK